MYLRNNNGYDVNNSVRWRGLDVFSNGHVRWTESSDVDELNTQADLIEKANRELLNSRPVIFRVRHLTSNGYSTHFVLGIGKCGNNYIIADPGDSNREVFTPTDPAFTLQGIRLFTVQ
jgi:hypothetical protein